ncbi:zf-CCHC domain-containing protein [Tanacetum coccineum]|uniref:Zf-CCHC domain-containing protein n=1 Tax=Tanacetum coccineum TaxID=301880 RepID=A0ABQ4ZXS3_9ASTR
MYDKESWNDPSEEVEEHDELIVIEVVVKDKVLGYGEVLEEDDKVVHTGWGDYQNKLIEEIKSQPISYYLKHEINKRIVDHLIDNNESLRKAFIGEMDCKDYEDIPIEMLYKAILKKKVVKKLELSGSFVLSCSTGIAEDVLVEVAGFVYPVDFVILDIEGNEYMSLILGMPFLTMARAYIRCSDVSMTLRAGKFKVRFIKTLRFPRNVRKKKRNNLDPMNYTNHVSRRILE